MSVAEHFHEFSQRPENLDFQNTPKFREKLMLSLKNLTESLKNAPNRESLPHYIFQDMLGILARLSHQTYIFLRDDPKAPDKALQLVEIATECFRTLRNSCAGCKTNQEEVLKNPGLYWIAATILSTLVQTPKNSPVTGTQEVIQCLRCGVQFLGNAAAGFEESKSLVWEAAFNTIRALLKAEDATLANYTCMLIYTCLTTNNMSDLISTADGVNIITAVMHHYSKHETEWGLYIMEKLLAHPSFIETTYKMLEDKERNKNTHPSFRTMLLELICNKLRTLEDKNDGRNHSQSRDGQLEIRVATGNITYIGNEFKNKSRVLLTLNKPKDLENKEPMIVGKLLEVLCSATATNHYQELQQDPELLKKTITLLQTVSQLGKQGDNVFSKVGKLSDGTRAEQGPAFGLKRDLIRLIGNLSYKHKANQDLVRELGGIPLILDHTNIDARNPFIQQWSVFALRNLTENNVDNQKVVNSLKVEGIADNSAFLRDYGMDAQLKGDKVMMKSTKKDDKGPFKGAGKR